MAPVPLEHHDDGVNAAIVALNLCDVQDGEPGPISDLAGHGSRPSCNGRSSVEVGIDVVGYPAGKMFNLPDSGDDLEGTDRQRPKQRFRIG
jgi:hypothetical protein